jgi:hypothetical protein
MLVIPVSYLLQRGIKPSSATRFCCWSGAFGSGSVAERSSSQSGYEPHYLRRLARIQPGGSGARSILDERLLQRCRQPKRIVLQPPPEEFRKGHDLLQKEQITHAANCNQAQHQLGDLSAPMPCRGP